MRNLSNQVHDCLACLASYEFISFIDYIGTFTELLSSTMNEISAFE